ncbi:MAG: PBP1A family penicillin-binding protein [Alphaproteobacteria bacterium]|nr:PBP1A family penicillin-binding protein [Alphaproteobacteria bacterium]
MARSDRRREPRFDDGDDDGELRAERRPPPRSRARKTSRRRSRSLIGALIYWSFTLSLWGSIAAGGLAVYYGSRLPPIDQLAVPKRPPNIAILDANGELLANRGDTGGAAVRLADLPPYVPKAFIAIEDRRFYSHWGVDPLGIGRAVIRNVTGHGGMQGGSTLTQQLAKNLFLTQERTISRKIQEAILALWLERKYSKDQILELYLNRVYFGSGAYGVEAAAERYFGHSAKTITLSEAAVLAGLMKAPSKLAPDRNPEGAAERAAQVVAAMAQEGHITEAMAKGALARPARARQDVGAGSINYAADYVMDMLDDTVGAIDQDIFVTTTIDARMQMAAEGALKQALDEKGAKLGVAQGALVAIDPTGAIQALVGGRDYSESQYNRAVSAKRQPGSAFKPFVYLAGLEQGLTPDSIREDGPLDVKGWRPENYSRQYLGPVTLTKALSLSLNTVAVRVGLEVGPKTVAKTAHRLGVQSDLQANASIALGTSEVTPLELVGAYAPFANGGIGVQPYVIVKVKTAGGRTLFQRKVATLGRVIAPQNVAMMNDMMRETLLTGTARKAELPGWEAAGKTGTSQDFRDAWFVGYTGRLIAGVWLGNDDNSPTKKASGGGLPVEIWSRFMSVALKGQPVAGLPSGAWRSENAAMLEEIAKPIDDLIGLFTGEPKPAPRPQPVRSSAAPRPPVALPGAPYEEPPPVAEARPELPAPRSPPPVPREIDDLLPPEDIPTVGSIERPRQRRGASERSVFEQLFGGG